MSDPILIEKNGRESLRLSVDEYKGRTLLSCRVWFKPSDGGDLRPGRDGWALSVEKLPDLIEGLQRLEQVARAGGLLT
jgi:hypothetical protein